MQLILISDPHSYRVWWILALMRGERGSAWVWASYGPDLIPPIPPWRRSSKPPLKSWNFRRDVWQTTDLTPPLPTPPPRPHVCFGLLKILLASKLANPRPQVPLNCSSSPWLKQRRKLYRKLRVSQLTPMCRRFKNTGSPLFTNVFLLLVLTKDFFNSLW